MTDLEDRRGDLAKFANAQGQPNQPIPHGHTLVRPTTGLADRIIGAQHVEVYRDEAKILQKLTTLAAAASDSWFYRFPVKTKGGGTEYVEGPSIKLANDLARIYGNCVIEVRELDVGDCFVFYARFTDIETGFSMERAYRQRKSQTSIKTKDVDRQLDLMYQVGQSKALRNVIVNALQTYSDFAFESARNSLVEKIGADLDRWRERTLQGLARCLSTSCGSSASSVVPPRTARAEPGRRDCHDEIGCRRHGQHRQDIPPDRSRGRTPPWRNRVGARRNRQPRRMTTSVACCRSLLSRKSCSARATKFTSCMRPATSTW
jgi:hypothetical protein